MAQTLQVTFNAHAHVHLHVTACTCICAFVHVYMQNTFVCAYLLEHVLHVGIYTCTVYVFGFIILSTWSHAPPP